MTRKCSVVTYENSYPKTRNVCIIDKVHWKLTPITYHSFPRDLILREKWIKATGRHDWYPSYYSFICSEHFRESDFYAIEHISGCRTTSETPDELLKVRRLLKRDAFPTQLLDSTISNNNDLEEDQQVSSTRQLSEESENEWNSTNLCLIAKAQIKTEPVEENSIQEDSFLFNSSIVVKEESDVDNEFSPQIFSNEPRGICDMNGLDNLSLEQKYEKLLEQYSSLKRDYDSIKTKYDSQIEAMNECEQILKKCR